VKSKAERTWSAAETETVDISLTPKKGEKQNFTKLYHAARGCQAKNLKIVWSRDGRNRTYIRPAQESAIRSHAAKRVETNLDSSVAIWVLAFKRPRVILPLYIYHRLCQPLLYNLFIIFS
jgi:hypothetical protein